MPEYTDPATVEPGRADIVIPAEEWDRHERVASELRDLAAEADRWGLFDTATLVRVVADKLDPVVYRAEGAGNGE